MREKYEVLWGRGAISNVRKKKTVEYKTVGLVMVILVGNVNITIKLDRCTGEIYWIADCLTVNDLPVPAQY